MIEKRIFDVVFSIMAIIFFAPIGILIVSSILIFSPGPIFYTCVRVGQNGSLIRCWKFRTMYVDADQRLESILKSSPNLNEEWKRYQKLKNDPRVTVVGKFLRKTSLDELPQFFNVLIGDLSVVGPRPATKEQIFSYYKDKAEKVLSIRPGITGLWQTSGRNALSFAERVQLEELYVNTRSMIMDMKIVLKTIYIMFFSKNGI